MATYVNDLRLKEIATGDEAGTWGTSTNTNLELISEAFSFGTEAITTNADTHTTTIADGSTDPGRSLFLKYTGTLDSTCTITIGPNTVSKLWFIENATSGSQSIIIKQGSGATITIANGQTKAIYSDGAGSGAAMVDAFTDLSVPSFFVSGALDVGGALTGTNATFTTADNTAQVALVSTDADASDGPILEMFRNSSSPADDDDLGLIKFFGENDASEKIEYGIIEVKAVDVSDGTEDGSINFTAMLNGTARSRLFSNSTETVFNEGSQDIDFRVESDGNANMLFVDGGNNCVGVGSASASAYGTMLVEGTGNVLNVNATSGSALLQLYEGGSGRFGIQTLDGSAGAKFTTAGTERMRIDSSGVVQISNATPTLKFTDTDNNYDATIQGLSGSLVLTADSGAEFGTEAIQFKTGGSERLRIDSSGLVGIGTSSPSKQLHQIRTGSASDLPTLATETGFITQSTNVAASSQNISIIAGASGESRLFFGDTADEDVGRVIYNHASNYMLFSTAATERLRIDSSGNVGIGSSSTDGRLKVSAASGASAAGSITLYGNNGGGFGGSNVVRSKIESKTDGTAFGANMLFYTNDTSNAYQERMRIDSSGNVGIATNLPSEKFTVEGVIRANRVGSPTQYGDFAQDNQGGYISTHRPHASLYENFRFLASNNSGSVERMRIDASGTLMVGKTDSALTTTGSVIGTSGTATFSFNLTSENESFILNNNNSTGAIYKMDFRQNNSSVGRISVGSSSTSYGTSSDYRLKENISDLTGATTRLKQLAPKRFNFIREPDVTVDGFLAHEVSSIVPEAVDGEKDAVDDDGNPKYQGIDQSKLVPLLVATIQELEARITQLENN
jgi:hypothetical protein